MQWWIMAALMPLAACGNGDAGAGVAADGGGTARSYDVADFTAVALRGADDVRIRTGGGFSVRAEGDPKVLDQLRIDRDGSTLRIGRRDGGGLNWGTDRTATIFVTMPRIVAATVGGSGDLRVDRVAGDRFAASDAGSGDLAVDALAVRTASVSLTGSGTTTLAGRADALDVSLSGSGAIAAGRLNAGSATVSVQGSGRIQAAVDGPARVAMMGSGDVDLGPRARCTTSRIGSGSVRCGG